MSIWPPLHVSASKPGKIITPTRLAVVVCAAQYSLRIIGTKSAANARADCDADASSRNKTSRSVAFRHTGSSAQNPVWPAYLAKVKSGEYSTNPSRFASSSAAVHTGGSDTSGMEKHGGFVNAAPQTASTSDGASSHEPQTYDTSALAGTTRLYQTYPSPLVTNFVAHGFSTSGELPAHVWFSISRFSE